MSWYYCRYYLKGPKKGTSDIFVDNLPGFPDNIKLNSRGNYFVGMGSVRFVGSSPLGSFLDLIGPYPGIKKVIAAVWIYCTNLPQVRWKWEFRTFSCHRVENVTHVRFDKDLTNHKFVLFIHVGHKKEPTTMVPSLYFVLLTPITFIKYTVLETIMY